jgi:Short C-terminal domain/Phospholipase_D-nuclease N-terminal
MLAFGLLDVFFSMLWFFLFIAWIVLLIRVFADIFRSADMGGFAKVIWMLFVIVLPLLGVFVYVISRGKGMTERDLSEAKRQDDAFRSYVQNAAGTSGVADELTKLTQLRDSGAITADDFAAAKAKLLA